MSAEAKKLCAGIQDFRPEVLELAESVLFMQRKLKEARKQIKDETLVIAYDNGGGQSGIRENPSFVSYEKLFSTYSKGLNTLMGIVNQNGNNGHQLSSLEDRRARLKIAK
jgi:hypothetical protein